MGNDNAIARSTSLKVIAAGMNIRWRNRELPKPDVPATVPDAEAMLPPISCSGRFCVSEIVFAAPLPAPALMEMVIDPAAVAVCRVIFAPAAMASDNAVPAMLVPEALIVFVPAAPPPDGTEIVTVLPETPTEATPAPLNWSTLLNVPLELEVVLPSAVSETVE